MNRDEIKEFVIVKPGVIEDFPFGDDVSVFKVGDKMFLLMSLENIENPEKEGGICFRITLKAKPEDVDFYTDNFDFITRGYYTNKRHWVTITVGEESDREFLMKLMGESYDLVFNSLTKKKKEEISR